ncbi:unnamed protein product [Pleuronectes platessa]|uniref:Leprecan-like alpha-helical domain-containing protein n=1 Tax=Pleuronectes platessa TaxID=8262 RepID=A0A9N7V3A1_PLEPL|nr:unnamed protein product [Pleuronectes platessa]
MDVNFSPAALCSVLLLSLASSATFLEPCDLLYETAVQAFYSGDYSGVVRSMEAALTSYTDVRSTRVRCRLQCQDKQPLDGSFSDLRFFDVVLRRAACMDACIEEKLGAQSVHKVSEDVVQDFRRRIPYNYLQLAYQKRGVRAAVPLCSSLHHLLHHQMLRWMRGNLLLLLHLGYCAQREDLTRVRNNRHL